jgi:hypothetical protein
MQAEGRGLPGLEALTFGNTHTQKCHRDLPDSCPQGGNPSAHWCFLLAVLATDHVV